MPPALSHPRPFPIGLAPRLIGATLGVMHPDEYEGRRLPIDILHGDLTRPPAWLPNVLAEKPFWFTTADGGIIDNDPFEYARFSLKNGVLQRTSAILKNQRRSYWKTIFHQISTRSTAPSL